MAVTILEVGRHLKPSLGDEFNAGEFESTGLPFMGGCEICAATVACYNSYPSKSGFIRCRDCIGDEGFDTVKEFLDATAN
jgi:hypothetical protein